MSWQELLTAPNKLVEMMLIREAGLIDGQERWRQANNQPA